MFLLKFYPSMYLQRHSDALFIFVCSLYLVKFKFYFSLANERMAKNPFSFFLVCIYRAKKSGLDGRFDFRSKSLSFLLIASYFYTITIPITFELLTRDFVSNHLSLIIIFFKLDQQSFLGFIRFVI